jgi:hypothetical protein
MGKIILSCGHEKPAHVPLEATEVMYREEACDPVDGFHRVVVNANWCLQCQEQAWFKEVVISSEAEGDAWLAAETSAVAA